MATPWQHPFYNQGTGGGGGGGGGQGGGGGTNPWTVDLASTFGSFWLALDTQNASLLFSEVNDNVSSRVYSVTDGGSWTNYNTYPPLLASPPFPAPTPDFLDAKGTFQTTSGGVRWYALGVHHDPFSAALVNLWLSVNNGVTWTATPINTTAWTNATLLGRIHGTDPNHLFLTKDPTGAANEYDIDFLDVLGWIDKVQSLLGSPPMFIFNAIYDTGGSIFVGAHNFSTDQAGLYFSQGGTTWVLLNGSTFTRVTEHILDIFAIDVNTIYVCTGGTSGSGQARIYKSTNGGASWTVDYQVTGTETAFSSVFSRLIAIHGNQAGSLWCVGQDGIILRAPFAGTWAVDPVLLNTGEAYTDCKVLPKHVYVAGQTSGVIRKTLGP